MKFEEIRPDEHPPYMKAYLETIDPKSDLVEELEISVHRFIRFVREIPMDKFDYRYAPGKWTIKEIIQHLIDCERIFAYRALTFARNDKTPLPGFEENDYAEENDAESRHLTALLTELAQLRQSNLDLFRSFAPEALLRTGTANGKVISVRALGFAIIGHMNHHERIYQERYLN